MSCYFFPQPTGPAEDPASNNLCGSTFVGWPVPIPPATNNFQDAYGGPIFQHLLDGPGIKKGLIEKYGCKDSTDLDTAIANLRYQLSFSCSFYAYQGIQKCAADPGSLAASASPSQMWVCPEPMNLAVNSLFNIIQNVELCPPTPATTQAMETLQGAWTQAQNVGLNVLGGSNTNCYSGAPIEVAFCGYHTKEQMAQNCPTQTDACCKAFVAGPAAPTTPATGGAGGSKPPAATSAVAAPAISSNVAVPAVTTPGNATQANASAGSSSSGSMTVPIVGALAGVLVVTLVIVGFVVYNRKRKPAAVFNNTSQYSPGYYGSQGGASTQESAGSPTRKQTINLNSHTPIVPVVVNGGQSNPANANGTYPVAGGTAVQNGHQQSTLSLQRQQQRKLQQDQEIQMQTSANNIAAYAAAGASALLPLSGAGAGGGQRDSTASSVLTEVLMRVIHPYNPSLADELTLVPGADVILLKPFDDGWGLGLNPTTGQQGAFPLVCVQALDQRHSLAPSEASQGLPTRFSKRVSSAYFAPEQMAAVNARASLYLQHRQPGQPGNPAFPPPMPTPPPPQPPMPAAGFNAGMQPPSTPVRNEYLMANGYDPALDEGLPSAALTNGIPSIVPSEAYGANFGMGAPPPMPVMQQAGQGTLRKGVTFTSEEPTLHVYRDSVTSAATSSDIGFRQ